MAACAEGLFPGNGTQISQEWRRKQLEYSWLRTLAGRHVDFWQVTEDALDYVAEAMRLEFPQAVRSALLDVYKTLPAFDDAVPMLATLSRQDAPRAALSNGSPPMLQSALAAAGIASLIDNILSVEAAGRFKIAPE